MMLTDPNFFQLKERALYILSECRDTIDPLMLPLCDVLNSTDFLTTVWCCSGHKAEENSLPYLVLVSKPDSESKVVELLKNIEKISEALQNLRIEVELKKLVSSWEGVTDYNTITLRWSSCFKYIHRHSCSDEGLNEAYRSLINLKNIIKVGEK